MSATAEAMNNEISNDDLRRNLSSTVEARHLIVKAMESELVPMVWGSPGIGKSDLVRSIAKEFKLYLIDIRLSQCDPTDLNGFGHVNKEAGKASYMPFDMWPLATDTIPAGYNGWLIFLDELSSADRGTQKAAYKVLLDKMVGMHPLHEMAFVVGAGNSNVDNALVEEMGTASQSRLMHINLKVDKNAWMDWALNAGIDRHITSFINFKPGMLHKFDPNHTDQTFACPRTWEFSHKLIKTMGLDDRLLQRAIAGCVSVGVANEFMSFVDIHDKLPNVTRIINDPENTEIPREAGIQYALCGVLAEKAENNTIVNIIKYLSRMNPEFAVSCLREVWTRKKEMQKNEAIKEWMGKFGGEYL